AWQGPACGARSRDPGRGLSQFQGVTMKLFIAGVLICLVAVLAQPSGDPLIEGFRLVEAASVADAMEQLYGQRAHMSHEMRPLFTTKFAGAAVTVLIKPGKD